MSWENSTRRARLPRDWPSIRARILERDPTCRLGYEGCAIRSTDCDHIVAGDDHSDGNLQGVCNPCHKRKTVEERPTRRRPQRRHPGA